VRQIALGSGHSLVLTCDGEVYATGRGDDGRLGLGSPMEWVSTPRRVRLGSGGGGQELRALAVAAGSYHSAIIDESGGLWMAGGALFGKLGLGEGVSASTPTIVRSLRSSRVLSVACGSKHTIALVIDSQRRVSVWAWGSSDKGVLGLPPASLPKAGLIAGEGRTDATAVYQPSRIPAFDAGPPVEQVASCGAHNLALAGGCVLARCNEGRQCTITPLRGPSPASLPPSFPP
jgi:alpha-tubulin suppressor-like RCC1 family protein